MTETSAKNRTGPAPVATIIGVLAVIGVFGSAFMAIAHLGIDAPLVGAAARLLPVAISFMVGTVLYAVLAYGAFRERSWAWAVGVLVNGLAFASTAAPPYRGGIEPIAIGVSAVALVLLVSRPGRDALLYRNRRESS